MRLKTNYLILIILAIANFGCQRDDICPAAEDTTPLLIIRFYDIDEPEEFLPPQNLGIRAEGNSEYVTIRDRNNPENVITFERFTGDSLAVPLKTNEDSTTFEFIINNNSEDQEPSELKNTDVIRFTYAREEEYINRACAYKVNYIGLKSNVQEGEDGAWIQEVQVDRTNIEDQNEAHVSIFF